MKGFFVLLIILLIGASLWAIGTGTLPISPVEVLSILCHKAGISLNVPYLEQQENVLWIIRLPRVLMAVLIGGTLSVCGAAMQGLFRNPLADPGLIGISSSASTAAVLMIVLGSTLFTGYQSVLGQYSLNIATFLGALLATVLIYRFSQQQGRTNVGIMLLAGVAMNAISGATTSFITLSANDQQLRSVTFWMMGSLGGANWINVAGILPFCLACCFGLPLFAKSLNAFSLGESDAAYLGIRTERLKTIVMLLVAMGVGASVAVSGIIGFVGLVVPHIIRMIIGPEHRRLLIASALGGATLLVLADLLSRTIAPPIEIPIGIITAMAGGPFFLYLLVREKKKTIFL
ncbi:MAG: iron ABC transporter permease [Taibaiella sp.]